MEQITAKDFFKSQSEFNKWLKELEEHEQDHVISMLDEYASLRSVSENTKESDEYFEKCKEQILINTKNAIELCLELCNSSKISVTEYTTFKCKLETIENIVLKHLTTPSPVPVSEVGQMHTKEFNDWLDKYFTKSMPETYVSKGNQLAYEMWELEYKYQRAMKVSPRTSLSLPVPNTKTVEGEDLVSLIDKMDMRYNVYVSSGHKYRRGGELIFEQDKTGDWVKIEDLKALSSLRSNPETENGLEEKDFAKQAIDKYPDKVNDYKLGKKALLGMFIGEAMKLSRGKCDPKKLTETVVELLRSNEPEREEVKWIALDNKTGTGSLKTHGFIKNASQKPYTGEPYVGNISLCGKIWVDMGDEIPAKWNELKGKNTPDNHSCKACLKIYNTQPSPPLKALSEITDEDYLEIAILNGYFGIHRTAKNGKRDVDYIFNETGVFEIEDEVSPMCAIKVYQYLQHKGYAVPVFYPVPEVKEKGDNNG